MERRKLGTSRMEVSVVALGTAAMGGDVDAWGRVDDNESVATIQRALDLGVNLIDTSPACGDGHGEEIVGKAVRDRRESVLLATTCGLDPASRPAAPERHRANHEHFIRACEASLRRLQTDYVDIYQCHRPAGTGKPIAETMSALRLLLDQGRIRAIRLSNFSCDQLAAALEYGPVHAVQVSFSMLHRRATEDLLQFCLEHDIAVLACGCLAKGLLTGKFRPDTPITGIRATDPDFVGARYRRNVERVGRLSDVAARYDRTVAQLAIQWVICHPGITSAVVGAKRPSQIVENVAGAGWELESEDLAAIERLLAGS